MIHCNFGELGAALPQTLGRFPTLSEVARLAYHTSRRAGLNCHAARMLDKVGVTGSDTHTGASVACSTASLSSAASIASGSCGILRVLQGGKPHDFPFEDHQSFHFASVNAIRDVPPTSLAAAVLSACKLVSDVEGETEAQLAKAALLFWQRQVDDGKGLLRSWPFQVVLGGRVVMDRQARAAVRDRKSCLELRCA